MNLNEKIIWTVTDGSEGMISQVKGLAQQFSPNILELKTDIIFPWSKLQPGFLPIYKWIFRNEFDFLSKPFLVISCGRKSIYTSLYIKKIFKSDIITIHIQNPRINSNNFDYVIAPYHDYYKGNNILNTFGAIHQFTNKMIKGCNDSFNISKKECLVSVIIGGPNQHYEFSYKIAFDLINKIKKLKKKYNSYSFFIISSRRTNKKILDLLIKELKSIAFVWDKQTKNPYLFALKHSKYFILTSDSTSMISECTFTGKPIYVYHLPFKRYSKRISKFHKEFEEKQITKKLQESLEIWNYKPLNEAERIAGILRTRILNK